MRIDRRLFIVGCGTLGITGCIGTAPSAQPANRSDLPPDLRPIENAAFADWLTAFRPRASSAGISSATLNAALAGTGFIPGVVIRDRNQIEFRSTLEDYLSIATSEERISKGRAAMSRHANTLGSIEARFGVDAKIVAAIWGMESQFGEKRGVIPVISATATLAFDGRRARFYEAQLLAALRILDRGDTTQSRLIGSWAGAMGHTQFIPTSYEAFAIDFTGDGRRDIWADDPTDALASTASYLAQNGWQTGLKWGSEAGTGGPSGRTIQPQNDGVRFTVTRNFDTIKTYNNSDFYAIAIGHLSDRLAGAGPLQGSFPPDANGLTKSDRLNVQRGLEARGYDIGTIDGVIGKNTQSAISDFQRRRGLPVNGLATPEVLAALR
ncbi:MAG: lytic murein transglycosylase [Yoonia sp.]|jgi:membrane-bound lytic murein transglycosylase B